MLGYSPPALVVHRVLLVFDFAVGEMGMATAPVVCLATWALFGIQEIGLLIEDPFQVRALTCNVRAVTCEVSARRGDSKSTCTAFDEVEVSVLDVTCDRTSVPFFVVSFDGRLTMDACRRGYL